MFPTGTEPNPARGEFLDRQKELWRHRIRESGIYLEENLTQSSNNELSSAQQSRITKEI